jgi:competence protein ComEA
MGIRKLKFLYSLFNPQSTIRNLQSLKYFSLAQQKFLFALALILLGSLYFRFYYPPLSPSSEESIKETVVEVLGEVQNPGVYLFQNTPTLKEAIEKAGGMKETAHFDETSSTEILETGTLLTVMKEPTQIYRSPPHSSPLPPREREKSEAALLKRGPVGIKHEEIKVRISRMEANKLLVFSLPLDLNRVSKEDLCLIQGIGESLAQEIITYRERSRGFRSVEELKKVKGIGEKKYQSIKNFFALRK